MGANYHGTPNPRNNGHTPQPPPCSTSVVTQFVPPILKTLILGALGKHQIVISESGLDPQAVALTNNVVQARDGSTDFTSPAGKRLQVFLENNRREGDDLLSSLRLQMNGEPVFQGSMTIRKAFSRQKVTFTHSLIGAIELFYDHLLQTVYVDAGAAETEMRIGVCHIRGRVSRQDIIRDVLASTIARRGRQPYPGFDYQLVYGIFPDEGFLHFFGDLCRLEESPLSVTESKR